MIYLDTNVLIYAFCKNVDDIQQKKRSQEILKTAIVEKKLLISEITLYEFVYVSYKLKESTDVIKANVAYLSKYVKSANIYDDVIKFINQTDSFQHSFDAYHIVFSNFFNC